MIGNFPFTRSPRSSPARPPSKSPNSANHFWQTISRNYAGTLVRRMPGSSATVARLRSTARRSCPASSITGHTHPITPPRHVAFDVTLPDAHVHVEITAGLITDRDPATENYGVYVYCNHRLVVKELKTRDVGYFVSTEAGVPHPDASLCRAIVQLQGSAQLIPWNSSKTNVNTAPGVFQDLRPTLIQLVAYFSSLSRRTKHAWGDDVTPYTSGAIEEVSVTDIASGKRLNLPRLPRVNKRQVEHLKADNERVLRSAPWTVGLLEAIAAVDILARQRLDTRNRIALILLDSNFEIGLKEFIVHRADLYPPKQYPDARIRHIFESRAEVIKEVTAHVKIPQAFLDKASHYYALRNKLIHERATVNITDAEVDDYRATVQHVLKLLFKLKFRE